MAIDGIAVSDFQNLHKLKHLAQSDAQSALPEVSRQFEAIFLQSMLKSMRVGQHFIDESSPFKGKYQESFQDMLDGQYAANAASGQGIGLATMLAKQLSQPADKTVSAPTTALGAFNTTTPLSVQQQIKPPLNVTPHMASTKEPTENQSIDDFVKSIWPYARQAASALGLDPKILVAQAALETGWGQAVAKDSHGVSSNNLFNIKAKGNASTDSVDVKTTEYLADTPIKTRASFKKYSSIEHSFKDYVSLIKENSRYEQALANARDPQRFVKEMHEAGYATDPKYADKILSIYHGDELQNALERNGYVMR